MSHPVLRAAAHEISQDMGGQIRHAIAERVNSILRNVVVEANDGAYHKFGETWMLATDADMAKAADLLKAEFSEVSMERAVVVKPAWGAQIVQRPSAIWIEGKTYRARMARCWSNADGRGRTTWAAEITDFGCQMLWGYRSSERKTSVDKPSEHLAERAMIEMFERCFSLRLVG